MLPAIGMLARGALEVGKYATAIAVPSMLGFLAAPKEYEKNFDYDYYNAENPRFYNQGLMTEDNPQGFDRQLFAEAMDEFYKIKPMY
jgi:hypothetical protein